MHFWAVAGRVFLNLKFQEVVNGGEGLGITGLNEDPAARFHLLVAIADFVLELLYGGDTRGHLFVNEHGDIEIALRKCLGDV